jgi:hypothetical protein
MSTYTYLLASLRDDRILAELPLRVSGGFGRRVKGYGVLRGTVDLSAREGSDLPALLSDRPRALYVDRDGVLVWGGIIWRGSRTGNSVEVQAMEMESYFARRVLTTPYKPEQVDQLAIARTLIATAQAALGGNIGVQVGNEVCGVLRDDDWPAFKNVHEALQEKANLVNGFDYLIDVRYEDGVPRKRLLLGYPRLGRSASMSELVWEKPGNITDWSDEWDAWESATEVWELGEGEGSTQVVGHARSATLDTGATLLQHVGAEHRTVSRQSTIDAHAEGTLAASPVPVRVHACEVKANAAPVLGSYLPGDEGTFSVIDDWYPADSNGEPTFSKALRIVGYSVNPTTDRVALTLGPAL